jgi:maltooligosyltrehalose trehalohydrolase
VRVMCNLGDKAVEFEIPAGFSLVLASRRDVAATGEKVVLPPDALAIVSGE